MIVEPLVQGAAGMRVHPPGYLRAVRELCDAHGVLLICDEVATGFGRTGRMFACEQEGVAPDLMCVAKGLTGGYLPLAATLATERIYAGFLGAHEEWRTFFHGHTYTGNPLACAAGLATLDVFEPTSARSSGWRRRSSCSADCSTSTSGRCRRSPRCAGAASWSASSSAASRPSARIGHQVTLAARRRGAIIRPLGDVVVLMPPLAIAEAELAPAGGDHRPADRRGDRRRPSSVVVGDEVLLARPADRAVPGLGDVLERRARRDAAVGIALGHLVDVAARLADPALGVGAHRREH